MAIGEVGDKMGGDRLREHCKSFLFVVAFTRKTFNHSKAIPVYEQGFELTVYA